MYEQSRTDSTFTLTDVRRKRYCNCSTSLTDMSSTKCHKRIHMRLTGIYTTCICTLSVQMLREYTVVTHSTRVAFIRRLLRLFDGCYGYELSYWIIIYYNRTWCVLVYCIYLLRSENQGIVWYLQPDQWLVWEVILISFNARKRTFRRLRSSKA